MLAKANDKNLRNYPFCHGTDQRTTNFVIMNETNFSNMELTLAYRRSSTTSILNETPESG